MKITTLSFIFILFFIFSCDEEKKEYNNIQNYVTHSVDGYVGDNNCKSCHEKEFMEWKGSHHDLAMQVATDSTVLGDFNNVKVKIDGVHYFFTKKADKFLVEIIELDGSTSNYKIDYAFGLTPLQQYLVNFDSGKKQVLRVTWDVIEKKWYHQYKGDKIQSHDWLHWTRGAQNWNTMCAECHSTNLKKDYFVEKDSFHTTYSSINVSCESCHGPAEKHMNWANEGTKSGNHYMIEGRAQMAQLNLCAPCHARRAKLTKNLEPGLNFEDQYMLQPLSSSYYHLDGQIDEEDYVYGSFVQSKMYQNGIKCSDCHNVHTLKLKETGNKLCMQCHVPKYNTEDHHFHKPDTEGAACINCHMTGKDYMGNDFRRDHSFRIPRPDQSLEFGTPNACNACHEDKSNKWAAEQIVTWYGSERASHFSDGLLLSHKESLTRSERENLNKFIADLNFPPIARATVIENLNFSTSEDFQVLLEALKDSSSMVRYSTLLKFRMLPLQDRMAIALKHATDTTRLVRIGAAQLMIGSDMQSLSEADQVVLNNSKDEFEQMLYSNADFSTGRMQLGDYYLQSNDVRTAIKHYESAIEKDSLLTPVYSNLATAYSMDGQTQVALKTLSTWIRLQPEAGRAFYLRALLYFEMKENTKAVEDLNTAIKIDSYDTRSMYNLATFYFQEKEYKKAQSNIIRALKIDPNNNDFKYLLALIYRDQGKLQAAQALMNELRQNQQ